MVVCTEEEVFFEILSRYSEQYNVNVPLCLKKPLFDFIMYEDEEKTDFYKNHCNDLAAITALRRCFRSTLNDGRLKRGKDSFIYHTERMIDIALDQLVQNWAPGMDTETLNILSAQVYESSVAGGETIVYFPSEKIFLEDPKAVPFNEDNRLKLEKAHAVRKQLSLCAKDKKHPVVLAVAMVKGELKTLGLAPKKAEKKYPSVLFAGHMHWKLRLPGKEEPRCLVQYRNSRLQLPLFDLSAEYQELAGQVFAAKRTPKRIARLVTKVNAKKGTIIIFMPEKNAQAEGHRLVWTYKRGYAFYPDDKTSRSLDVDNHLAQFSSIDGAILCDEKGNCWAYGVILDGDAAPGSPERGAKYNCTLAYSRKLSNIPHICAVFSEDGMVDFFTSADSENEHS